MTQTDVPSSARWPDGRGSFEDFAADYGEPRAQRFLQAFHETDSVADALFTSGHTVREIMPNLHAALARGTADEKTFPEVAALIDDMTAALSTADAELLERGRRVYLSIPPLAHGLALGPGSLVHTYSTPSIADLLLRTGELTDGAVTRLAYTTNWIYSLFISDGLTPGGTGFVHSGMVRTMHAHVRHVHTTKGHDHSRWGAPINQFDMLRTWLDFTYIPYSGLRRMGWSPSTQEMQDIFSVWKIVGALIGIPADLLDGLDDIESSQETMDAVHAVDGEPNENSQALVDALMHGFAVNAQNITGLPADTLADWTAAHVSIIHGPEVAESYGVARSLMQPILEMNTPAVAERYDLLRADAEALDREIAKNEEIILSLLTDDTSYTKQEAGVSMKSAA
jgi:hypothetical protein